MNSGQAGQTMQGNQAGQGIDPSMMMSQPQPLPEGMGIDVGSESVEHETGEAKLRAILEDTNIAEKLDKDKLHKIGANALEGYTLDKQSRQEWEKNSEEWTRLATQVREDKTFPWAKASRRSVVRSERALICSGLLL